MAQPFEPRDCPHGVQYRKRMHLCAPCMEPVIDQLEAALRDVLAEYEYQIGPFDAGHEPDVIRAARGLLSSMRTNG